MGRCYFEDEVVPDSTYRKLAPYLSISTEGPEGQHRVVSLSKQQTGGPEDVADGENCSTITAYVATVPST